MYVHVYIVNILYVKICIVCSFQCCLEFYSSLVDIQGYPYICPSHYCTDSQITTLKLYLIATQFVNFKHNFPPKNEIFFKN